MFDTRPEDNGGAIEREADAELPGAADLSPVADLPPAAPGWGTVAAAFGMGFLFALLLVAVGSLFTLSRSALLLFFEIGLFGGVLVHLALSRHSTVEAVRFRAVPTPAYALSVQLGIALLIANLAATGLFGPFDQGIDIDVETAGIAERLTLAAAIALAAPVAEETLFRGLLQGVLERKLGPWLAILAAAVPFALLHGVPGPGLIIFFWTLPIGWVAWRTGSIAPGLVIHVLNNLVGVIVILGGTMDAPSAAGRAGSIALLVALLAASVMWATRICLRIAAVAARD